MRAIRAAVAVLALSISVASADPVAVVTMVAGHSSQPMFEGMTPVHVGKIKSSNMTAAKVIGDAYNAIPVAPSNYMSHPTILNADGSVYGQPQVVAVPHPHHHHRRHAHQGMPIPFPFPVPEQKPMVFTSPNTNVQSNLPAPLPPTADPLASLMGLNNLPPRTVRRINREISKLVKLIVLADAKGKHSQVLSLNRVLKRVTQSIRKYPTLAPLVLNAHDMVRDAVVVARKAAKKISSKKFNKKITSTKIALESSAIAKSDNAILSAARGEIPVNKTVAAPKAASKDIKKMIKKVKAAAKANTTKALKKEIKAAAKKTDAKASIDAAKAAIVKSTIKAVKSDTSDSSALELTVQKLVKRVEILTKAAVSFKKQLGDDKSSIASIQGNVGSLQKGQSALESHVKVINSQIADVYKKYKSLTKKEKRLTLAAKRAISTLSGRVKSQSHAVRSVMKSKKHFKKSIVASLAQLQENIQNLQEMAH